MGRLKISIKSATSPSLLTDQHRLIARFLRTYTVRLEQDTLFCVKPISLRHLATVVNWSVPKLLRFGRQWLPQLNLNSVLSPAEVRIFCDRLHFKLDTSPPPTCTQLFRQLQATTLTAVSDLKFRPPVVTILGHVDHGKTTLLEQLRQISVRAKEQGGITQHMGIYQVPVSANKTITFIDTPGHAVFAKMRAFGATATDIALLVVAADDGVKPQTIEAVRHAQAAKTPVIVFINKTDLATARPQRVLDQLSNLQLVPEAMGGDTIVVRGSARYQRGINQLLEAISLLGEVLALKSNPQAPAAGLVLDCYSDAHRGSLAVLLVRNGTLHKNDLVLAGDQVAKVKLMHDSQGQMLTMATAGNAVKVTGFAQLPSAGSWFMVMHDLHQAEQLATIQHEEYAPAPPSNENFATLFANNNSKSLAKTKLNLVVKADTSNTLLAMVNLISELSLTNFVPVIIHRGVGAVSETDLNLAIAGQALIVNFNVKVTPGFYKLNQTHKVKLISSQVIYRIGESLKALDEAVSRQKVASELGRLTVLKTFPHSRFGMIAGCRVDRGEIKVNSKIRIMRQHQLVCESIVVSLKRLKDDIKSARTGQECGVTIKNFQAIKIGDEIIVIG